MADFTDDDVEAEVFDDEMDPNHVDRKDQIVCGSALQSNKLIIIYVWRELWNITTGY